MRGFTTNGRLGRGWGSLGRRRTAVISAVLLLSACGSAAATSSSSASTKVTVGANGVSTNASGKVCYLVENTTTPAFIQEEGWFDAAMKQMAPNMTVITQNANNSQQTQQSQVESCITRGVGAIALHPVDSSSTGGELLEAAAAKVPVIVFEQPATGGPMAYYISPNFHQVGEVEGQIAARYLSSGPPKTIMRLWGDPGDGNIMTWIAGQNVYLDPLIASGQVKVACQNYTTGWVPATAQQEVEQCLTKTNNGIDAVVAVQDFLANAAVAALTTQHLQGKVPVFGGVIASVGVDNMLLGYQNDDVMANWHQEQTFTAEASILAMTKTKAPAGFATSTYTNTGYPPIPFVVLAGTQVTTSQIQTVVDTGLMTWSDICTGPAAQTSQCVAQG